MDHAGPSRDVLVVDHLFKFLLGDPLQLSEQVVGILLGPDAWQARLGDCGELAAKAQEVLLPSRAEVHRPMGRENVLKGVRKAHASSAARNEDGLDRHRGAPTAGAVSGSGLGQVLAADVRPGRGGHLHSCARLL